MKRNNFAVLFVLIALVLTFASCQLGVSVSTSEQSTGQRTEEQMEPEAEPQPQPKPDKLSGVFTVNSSGKKVQFSKGALYWDGSSFKMEENQYDFRTWHNSPSVINGEYNANNTDIADGVTGLFYWSKDVEKTYAPNYNDTGRTSDTFALANGGTGAIAGWDVLNNEEWEFLISRKDNSDNYKYGLATITTGQGATVEGLVLLPDEWTMPAGFDFTPGYGGAGYGKNNYTSEQWAKMEQAGAVFLPAAGYRAGSEVSNVGVYSHWWSSTPLSSNRYSAYYLFFFSDDIGVYDDGRDFGKGVRLVAPVEN